MSEYQYYEFQALDRALTAQEQKTLQALFSRAQVTPSLKAFMEWVALDTDPVAAAAQDSPSHQSAPARPLESWLPQLTEAECQQFLLKLVRRKPHVDVQLINRLKELAVVDFPPPRLLSQDSGDFRS